MHGAVADVAPGIETPSGRLLLEIEIEIGLAGTGSGVAKGGGRVRGGAHRRDANGGEEEEEEKGEGRAESCRHWCPSNVERGWRVWGWGMEKEK